MYADDSKLCSCEVILLLGLTLIRVHHNIITTFQRIQRTITVYLHCLVKIGILILFREIKIIIIIQPSKCYLIIALNCIVKYQLSLSTNLLHVCRSD